MSALGGFEWGLQSGSPLLGASLAIYKPGVAHIYLFTDKELNICTRILLGYVFETRKWYK
jgi:hypothetical protein